MLTPHDLATLMLISNSGSTNPLDLDPASLSELAKRKLISVPHPLSVTMPPFLTDYGHSILHALRLRFPDFDPSHPTIDW